MDINADGDVNSNFIASCLFCLSQYHQAHVADYSRTCGELGYKAVRLLGRGSVGMVMRCLTQDGDEVSFRGQIF